MCLHQGQLQVVAYRGRRMNAPMPHLDAEKLIVGWKWVEILTPLSLAEQLPSHLLHHLKQMKTGLIKFMMLFPDVLFKGKFPYVQTN